VNGHLLWYAARADGIVAWALLATSLVAGLALSSRIAGRARRGRPAWVLDLHRFLGGAAVVFTVVHVVTIMLDTYVHFGLVEVLVPFASKWHPVAVAWGIAGGYLLLAVELTSLVRARLSERVWHAVHFASFPMFVLATTHALTAGADRHAAAVRMSAAAASALIAALTALRVRTARIGGTPEGTPRKAPDITPILSS
jgi:predicted ferric reductase